MTNNSYGQNSPAYKEAVRRQAEATSPENSVFVSANAGTGKTHVLTNRVLRLLLSGASPDTILCVTYTKAAAAEMRFRLSEKLQKWAVCDQAELREDLFNMGEERPTQQQLARARELFAYILDFGDSPRIDTLHSFCQHILRRFPVEADVTPFFEMISEEDSDSLLSQSFLEIVDDAYRLNSPLVASISFLIDNGQAEQILSHLRSVLSDRKMIAGLAESPLGAKGYAETLETVHHFTPPEKLADAEADACAQLGKIDIKLLADRLMDGGVTAQKLAAQLYDWLALDAAQKPARLSILMKALFTAEHTRRAKYADKKVTEKWGRQDWIILPVLTILEEIRSKQASAICYAYSVAIADLAIALYRRYQQAKTARSVLDYDDLIHFTEQLLSRTQMMAWVRYKLDQGIDHILLDEAQDTSPQQWALLHQLTDSFFDGSEQDRDQQRTLFVVGDYKQSIYSFQGARPDVFVENNIRYQKQAKEAQKPFREIDFGMSFRSCKAVLEFVDELCTQIDNGDNGAEQPVLPGLGADIPKHESFKSDMAGLVEVRSQTLSSEEDSITQPFTVASEAEEERADLVHARAIASQIKGLISGDEADRFGRIFQPSDILVLVRSRNRFYALLRSQLELLNVPVAGADRIKLNNQIEILDLLALGDVCLLPQNDLQLAAVLKSPLIGLDEDALFSLCHDRGKLSLFERLRAHDGAETVLGQAAAKILHWQRLSDTVPLYEFWSAVLNQGGREALYRRLGGAIDDSLNVFLQKARDFGQTGRTGLYHFLLSFRQSGGEIKRDFDARSQNEVRVMSMHGAKGLQAPVVFLPDTLRQTSKPEPIANTESGPLWVSSETELADQIASLKQQQIKARKDEEDRLLYVALTRAEQALFISGWEKKNSRFYPDSWHELMVETISNMTAATQPEKGVWQLASGHKQTESEAALLAPEAQAEVPDWFYQNAPDEPVPARPLNPSELDDAGDQTPYRHANRHSSLLAGSYAHKLFEYLPRQNPEDRAQAAAFLARQFSQSHLNAASLSQSQIDEIDTQVFSVLDHPEFTHLFSPDALTEQSVSGLIGSVAVTGQIDRMLIEKDRVILLDFKTGSPPEDAQNLPQPYISQMASYGALIEQIYPDKQIICYLLWTQNCSLSEVTKTARDKFVASLG